MKRAYAGTREGTGVALWPNPSFFPKWLAPAHFNQVIELAAYDPSCLQDEETSRTTLSSEGLEALYTFNCWLSPL